MASVLLLTPAAGDTASMPPRREDTGHEARQPLRRCSGLYIYSIFRRSAAHFSASAILYFFIGLNLETAQVTYSINKGEYNARYEQWRNIYQHPFHAR